MTGCHAGLRAAVRRCMRGDHLRGTSHPKPCGLDTRAPQQCFPSILCHIFPEMELSLRQVTSLNKSWIYRPIQRPGSEGVGLVFRRCYLVAVCAGFLFQTSVSQASCGTSGKDITVKDPTSPPKHLPFPERNQLELTQVHTSWWEGNHDSAKGQRSAGPARTR